MSLEQVKVFIRNFNAMVGQKLRMPESKSGEDVLSRISPATAAEQEMLNEL